MVFHGSMWAVCVATLENIINECQAVVRITVFVDPFECISVFEMIKSMQYEIYVYLYVYVNIHIPCVHMPNSLHSRGYQSISLFFKISSNCCSSNNQNNKKSIIYYT